MQIRGQGRIRGRPPAVSIRQRNWERPTVKAEQQRERERPIFWIALIIVFTLGIAIALAWFLYSQHRQQQAVRARQEYNNAHGLSNDFPSDRVPLYPGIEVLECERSSATATTGEPMDKWYVHGQIDQDKQPIYEFYHQHFIDSGMRQTQYISIPTGYGINYGDEVLAVEAVIEVRQGSDLTQVELTVYRVR